MRCSDLLKAILLAAASLAACQPAPPSGPRHPALAPLPDAAGLTVLPLEGLPPRQAKAAATAMADALGDLNIPAATEGANLKSRFVAGTARIEPASRGAFTIRVGWRLVDRAGMSLGTYRAAATVARAHWDQADRKAFRALADGAAQRFAALVQAPAEAAAPQSGAPEPPRLHVWPIEGAPGGGNALLRREMQIALRRHGHVLSDEVGQGTLVVSGWVELGPPRSGQRALSVSWAVLDWRGRELGTLNQSKPVPAAEVESGWPRFAALIAEGAAGGMGGLLRKARERQAGPPPAAFTAEGGAGKVRPPRKSRSAQ